MKAILLADRNGAELQPLTHKTCVALLPIVTKPLIEYTLDALLLTGVKEVIVVISAHAELMECHLGSGERWGMSFHYVLSRGQEEPATILARLGTQLSDCEYLLVRADLLCSFNIKEFLIQAGALEGQIVATIDDRNTGVCLLRKQAGTYPWQISNLLSFPLHSKISSNSGISDLTFHALPVNGNLSLLDSLKVYHQANLATLAGHFPTLVLPPLRQVNENLRVGPRSTVPKHNVGVVGTFCRVRAEAALLGDVVLCHKIIVDRNAKLSATVVLPCTYIGKAVKLRNAIVWGNVLIRVDTGAVKQIVDNLILANFSTETLQAKFAGVFNQGLGLLTFLISLPLWPLALLAALMQNPRAPLRKIKLHGNVRTRNQQGILHPNEFTTYLFSTSIVLLRNLPKILAVMNGQLRMVGVSPETPAQANIRVASFEKIRDCAPVGIIGPSQVSVPPDAPIEERLVVEAYYARTRHFGIDALWLLRGLLFCFTKRAWWQKNRGENKI